MRHFKRYFTESAIFTILVLLVIPVHQSTAFETILSKREIPETYRWFYFRGYSLFHELIPQELDSQERSDTYTNAANELEPLFQGLKNVLNIRKDIEAGRSNKIASLNMTMDVFRDISGIDIMADHVHDLREQSLELNLVQVDFEHLDLKQCQLAFLWGIAEAKELFKIHLYFEYLFEIDELARRRDLQDENIDYEKNKKQFQDFFKEKLTLAGIETDTIDQVDPRSQVSLDAIKNLTDELNQKSEELGKPIAFERFVFVNSSLEAYPYFTEREWVRDYELNIIFKNDQNEIIFSPGTYALKQKAIYGRMFEQLKEYSEFLKLREESQYSPSGEGSYLEDSFYSDSQREILQSAEDNTSWLFREAIPNLFEPTSPIRRVYRRVIDPIPASERTRSVLNTREDIERISANNMARDFHNARQLKYELEPFQQLYELFNTFQVNGFKAEADGIKMELIADAISIAIIPLCGLATKGMASLLTRPATRILATATGSVIRETIRVPNALGTRMVARGVVLTGLLSRAEARYAVARCATTALQEGVRGGSFSIPLLITRISVIRGGPALLSNISASLALAPLVVLAFKGLYDYNQYLNRDESEFNSANAFHWVLGSTIRAMPLAAIVPNMAVSLATVGTAIYMGIDWVLTGLVWGTYDQVLANGLWATLYRAPFHIIAQGLRLPGIVIRAYLNDPRLVIKAGVDITAAYYFERYSREHMAALGWTDQSSAYYLKDQNGHHIYIDGQGRTLGRFDRDGRIFYRELEEVKEENQPLRFRVKDQTVLYEKIMNPEYQGLLLSDGTINSNRQLNSSQTWRDGWNLYANQDNLSSMASYIGSINAWDNQGNVVMLYRRVNDNARFSIHTLILANIINKPIFAISNIGGRFVVDKILNMGVGIVVSMWQKNHINWKRIKFDLVYYSIVGTISKELERALMYNFETPNNRRQVMGQFAINFAFRMILKFFKTPIKNTILDAYMNREESMMNQLRVELKHYYDLDSEILTDEVLNQIFDDIKLDVEAGTFSLEQSETDLDDLLEQAGIPREQLQPLAYELHDSSVSDIEVPIRDSDLLELLSESGGK